MEEGAQAKAGEGVAAAGGEGLIARRRARRARREAREFLREVRRLMARHGAKVKPAAREKIEAGVEELARVADAEGEAAILDVARPLNQLVDKHLGFARKSTFREYVESIGLAVLIALLLRAFVVEAFKIPSGSMIPTLRVGDHIFVNKFTYGLRMPFTKWWMWQRRQPERGDVVVFMYPLEEDKDFIKRIVAVPGDTLELRDHELVITDAQGVRVPATQRVVDPDYRYVEQDPEHDGPPLGEVPAVAIEERLGDADYTILYNKTGGRGDFGPVKVREGHVFVMGDNRDNSHDARFWGLSGDGSIQVPVCNIKGKAMFIWWSSHDVGRIGDGIE